MTYNLLTNLTKMYKSILTMHAADAIAFAEEILASRATEYKDLMKIFNNKMFTYKLGDRD